MRCASVFAGTLLLAAGLTSAGGAAVAQTAPAACQPPAANEYLLLVLDSSRQAQRQLKRALPRNAEINSCRYFNDVVVRVGGLRSLEDANAWAQYVKDIVGLQSVIAQPATAAAPSNTAMPFNPVNPMPQAAGTGYAVLVDASNPEAAMQVRQVVGSDAGLVDFAGRQYLLAVLTTNQNEASNTLRQLSDRGLMVMMVDGRKVTWLR